MSPRDEDTEPPGPPLSEPELDRALGRWLAAHPLPSALHPFLRGVLLGLPDDAIAAALGVRVETLESWRRSFALWSTTTVERAVSEILVDAARARREE